jgi:hypothetical protein
MVEIPAAYRFDWRRIQPSQAQGTAVSASATGCQCGPASHMAIAPAAVVTGIVI